MPMHLHIYRSSRFCSFISYFTAIFERKDSPSQRSDFHSSGTGCVRIQHHCHDSFPQLTFCRGSTPTILSISLAKFISLHTAETMPRWSRVLLAKPAVAVSIDSLALLKIRDRSSTPLQEYLINLNLNFVKT